MPDTRAPKQQLYAELSSGKRKAGGQRYAFGLYEFGLEIESVLGKFEKTIYNDISSTG